MSPSDRLLAARGELIERIERTAESHALDSAELVAACVHAVAAALIERRKITDREAGEALQAAVRRYLTECRN